MNRIRIFACVVCAICALLLASSPASSAVYYGFTVGVANAPRPPVIRRAREPHALLASDAMVYVVDDASLRFDGDLFHYGQYWFAYTRGYWYRARSHRGPYAVIEVRKVPRAIIGVPRTMWRHHPLALAAAKSTNPAKAAHVRHAAQPRPQAHANATRGERRAASGRIIGPPAPQRSKHFGSPAAAEPLAAIAPAAPGTPRNRRGSLR